MVHCLKDLHHVLAWIARYDADAPDHRCLLMTRSTVEMGVGGVLEAISMHRPSQHKFDASTCGGRGKQIQKDTFFGSHQRGGGRKDSLILLPFFESLTFLFHRVHVRGGHRHLSIFGGVLRGRITLLRCLFFSAARSFS